MSDSLQNYLAEALKKVNFDDSAPKKNEYDLYQDISDMLVEARTEAGLTQGELAKLCGVSQSNISKFETGCSHPSLQTLKKIADGMGKRLVLFFVDDEDDDEDEVEL